MMFSVTLMCCEYRDVLLLTRVQTSQQDTSLCDYALTRSNDALCIQPSVLELYVNAKMCEPCPSCRIFMQIDISDARNSNSFSVIFLFHSNAIIHCHAKTLLLQPTMPYSQASDHSVTVGLTNTMLLISTPLVETLWRNLIHSWGSWQCHSWSRCGPRGFPLFSKWRIWFKKYHDGGMTCAV